MIPMQQSVQQLLAIRMHASDSAQLPAHFRCCTFADDTKRICATLLRKITVANAGITVSGERWNFNVVNW